MSKAQFHKGYKHKNLISTENSCFTETGYQLTIQKVNILATGVPLIFS